MKNGKQKLFIFLVTSVCAAAVFAATQIFLKPSVILSGSTGAPAAENSANKGKILRLTDGTLVVVYGDAIDTSFKAWDYNGDIYSALNAVAVIRLTSVKRNYFLLSLLCISLFLTKFIA